MKTTADRKLADLVLAADKINAFCRSRCVYGQPVKYGLGTAAPLATASAFVSDDSGGPLTATDVPDGQPRLTVSVERFREHARSYTEAGRAEMAEADRAETEIIRFCESLGFKVELESHAGSGEYGPVNMLHLS